MGVQLPVESVRRGQGLREKSKADYLFWVPQAEGSLCSICPPGAQSMEALSPQKGAESLDPLLVAF